MNSLETGGNLPRYFWSGRIWWLPLTWLQLWLRVVAVAPTLITYYNFCEKPRVIFELFLPITNFAATRFIIKSSIKMRWHELHDTSVTSEISSLVRQQSTRTAWCTFSKFSLFLLVEGAPQRGWSSTDISPLLKWLIHSYPCVYSYIYPLQLLWASSQCQLQFFLTGNQISHTDVAL